MSLQFLQRRGPELHVVEGYAGRIVIDRQVANGIFMDGEASTQNAEKFINASKR
jgi:hypothetical protein